MQLSTVNMKYKMPKVRHERCGALLWLFQSEEFGKSVRSGTCCRQDSSTFLSSRISSVASTGIEPSLKFPNLLSYPCLTGPNSTFPRETVDGKGLNEKSFLV